MFKNNNFYCKILSQTLLCNNIAYSSMYQTAVSAHSKLKQNSWSPRYLQLVFFNTYFKKQYHCEKFIT